MKTSVQRQDCSTFQQFLGNKKQNVLEIKDKTYIENEKMMKKIQLLLIQMNLYDSNEMRVNNKT